MRISDWSSDVCSSDLGGLDADVDDVIVLLDRHRGAFARRAAWHQSGRTLANLPVHERRERRLVETAVAKWCHKRREGTLKHGIAPCPRPQIRYQSGRASCRERVRQYVE